MCLYVEDDDGWTTLDDGFRRARKPHRCAECGRTVTPGESYFYQTVLYGGTVETHKMCGHCRATITLGSTLTGCPEAWYWGMVFDRYEAGFVADVLDHPGLAYLGRLRMLRCVAAQRRQWRWRDGSLMPVPALEAA